MVMIIAFAAEIWTEYEKQAQCVLVGNLSVRPADVAAQCRNDLSV